MTARVAFILLVVGYVIDWIASASMQYWPYTAFILFAAFLLMALSAVMLLFKVWRYPGFKDFLDC